MVWQSLRKLFMLGCALAVLLAEPITARAASYTPYDGSISSTYTQVFRDIAGKISPFEDYVFFRAGQFEYMLIAGELEYDGVRFTGESCTVYKIAADSGVTAYNQEEITDFSLEPGISLVYSNLGPFPDLIDGSQRYTFAVLLLGLVALCMFLVRPFFGFTLRRR